MLGPVRAHRGSAVLGEGQVLPSRSSAVGGESSAGARLLGEEWALTCTPHPGSCVYPWAVQEEELVELLAQHCYVQLGASAGSQAIRELLPSCVPSKLYRTKTPEKWASLVTTTYAKVSLLTACVLWLCSSFWRWWAPWYLEGLEIPTH